MNDVRLREGGGGVSMNYVRLREGGVGWGGVGGVNELSTAWIGWGGGSINYVRL